MKLIIAGSRSLNPTLAQISSLIDELPSLVICGCAEGVDRAGYEWARHFSVPVEFFPAWGHQATWARLRARRGEVVHSIPRSHVVAAGPMRNRAMGAAATSVILLSNGASPGTINMRDAALRLKLPVVVKIFQNNEKGVCVGPIY